MHRTYSMRQSRAPTASQIQNPPPPSSTTKSGRFFGKAGLGGFCFSFSPFLRFFFWEGERAHRFLLLAVPNPSRASSFQHGRLIGMHDFIQNISNTLSPFFIATPRPQTLPISRLNHLITFQAHDSAQCPSFHLYP